MNAITTTPMPLSYDALERLAESIAKSGLFGMKTKDQAIALMMIAHAEGTHPALAARDYDVIQGKPAKKAEAMMRDFISAGGKVEWHALTDDLADATFTHPQTGSVRIDWNIERARVAGFAGKDNWKKFPRAMLRSRVVSEGVRTVWPLATSGLYVPEEVADFKGTTLDAEDDLPVAPIRAAAAPMPRGARIAERAPAYEAPKPHPQMPNGAVDPNPIDAFKPERTDAQWRVWLDKMKAAGDTLYRREELVEMVNRASVGDAIANGPQWVRAEISAYLAEAYARFPEEELTDDELPEVKIAGEEKIMSG